MVFIKKIIGCVLDTVFPNKCIGCDRIISKNESLCEFCLENLEKTNFDNRCKVCGNIKSDCKCKYHVYHFTAATAPFYNDGVSQKIMYAFKFNRKMHFAKFIAERMAISVKNDFYGMEFDCVVYVPLNLKRELKRGYNQSRELAKELSHILNLPLVENALGCNEKRLPQNKTKGKERFENVKGMYYPNISLRGRRVLLVDDIKTTGATLDECAKALFKAGADDVYCVTGLISKGKNKKR
jgi:ComF family protein